jgi:Uma2 family endonuclease
MSSAADYLPHYTHADNQQWDGDWELWRGSPVAMSPASGFRHQQVAAEVFSCLRQALQQTGCDECRVVYELDWKIAEDTVVRPDISLVCGTISGDYIESPPQLIVEVISPSTAHKDRTAKRALYQQEGVDFYLLADLDSKRLEIWQLEMSKYIAQDASAEHRFQLTSTCQITPDFSLVFR